MKYLLIILLLSSCHQSTVEPRIIHDTMYVIKRDTVIIRDTIYRTKLRDAKTVVIGGDKGGVKIDY